MKLKVELEICDDGNLVIGLPPICDAQGPAEREAVAGIMNADREYIARASYSGQPGGWRIILCEEKPPVS